MLITKNVHLIDGIKGAKAYLIAGDKPFIVDTGFPKQENIIINYLEKVSISPQSIQGIIITHYDVDHCGSANALQEILKCPVYAHPEEIPYMLGKTPRHGLKRLIPHLVSPLYGKLHNPQEIHPLNETFADWEIIHTPGHTPGHIVVYKDGMAIVGDLLQGGKIRLAPFFLNWHKDLLYQSVNKIIQRPISWIMPGHGPVTQYSEHWLDALKKKVGCN